MQRSFLSLCVTILLLSGCVTARNRPASGESSAERTTESANNGFSDGIVEWLAGLPFAFIEVIIEDEWEESRFSDRELKKMGIERGSKEHQALIAQEKLKESFFEED